jgi:hypothetical protein
VESNVLAAKYSEMARVHRALFTPHEAMNRSHYNTLPLVSDWRGGRIDYDIVHMDAASALSEGFLGCVPRPTG